MTGPAENTPHGIAERILLAADLAEQAAAKATQGERVIRIEGGVDPTGEGWSQISVDFGPQDGWAKSGCMFGDAEDGELAEPDALLTVASGPPHWRALAVLLRAVTAEHQPRLDDEEPIGPFCSICKPITILYPCPTVAALLPVADQIIADLASSSGVHGRTEQ